MYNAQLRIRAISEEALDVILDMIREEAKDVRVETWVSTEPADYKPRGAYIERPITPGRR